MSLSNKLENAYLGILRYVILVVATLSLIVVVIAAGMMLKAVLSSPPKAPEKVKFEDKVRDLKKGFTVDDFKKDDQQKAEKKVEDEQEGPGKAPTSPKDDSFVTSVRNNVSKIADNFIAYEKAVNNNELNKERLQNVLLNAPGRTGVRQEKSIVAFYFETLSVLSTDLARQAPEFAKLPVEKRIISDRLLDWHAAQVNKAVEAVDEANAQRNAEFQKKQETYIEKKTLIFKYACVAGGAFFLFLIIIMLSIMVKIERNLRPLQQIVDNGKTS